MSHLDLVPVLLTAIAALSPVSVSPDYGTTQNPEESTMIQPEAHTAGSTMAEKGRWKIKDGRNMYIGESDRAGVLVVENIGPGTVEVQVQSFFPWKWNVYTLRAGESLRVRMSANRHVEIWDTQPDCLAARGSYHLP